MLSHFIHFWLFAAPWTVVCQAPLSVGFSWQEYWSGLPCPLSEDLPDPGIEPASLMSPALAGRFFTTSTIWEAPIYCFVYFWLCWVFIAACGLCSSCGRRRLLSRCSVQASHCYAFFLLQRTGSGARGLQSLWGLGSVVAAPGLSSSGSVVVPRGLCCSLACGNLPEPGI